VQVLEYIDKDLVQQMIGNREILTDENRLKATTGLKIDSTGMKCEVVHPTQVTDFDKIPLQVSIVYNSVVAVYQRVPKPLSCNDTFTGSPKELANPLNYCPGWRLLDVQDSYMHAPHSDRPPACKEQCTKATTEELNFTEQTT
jgi:hypothetical protein